MNNIEEKLLTFNKKAYPKFGNILLMAGGAGSGKGFVLNNLVGIEGKVMDTDKIKENILKTVDLKKAIKEKFGIELDSLNLKNPAHVSILHDLIANKIKIDSSFERILISSLLTSDKKRLPNIIFDKTVKNIQQIESISEFSNILGYDKKNIHMIWVINDFNVAIKQNNARSRVVSKDIIDATHTGVSNVMAYIVREMKDSIKDYIDGDIYIVFNQSKVDSIIKSSKFGGQFIEVANYMKIKESGKAIDLSTINKSIVDKITNYVPNPSVWE